MSNIEHAIIACAGLGTRLGLNKPKCMIEFHGKPLIYYQLQLLHNIEDVRMVVGFQEEKIMNYVKEIRNDVTFIRNDKYMETSQNHSYWLGAKDLRGPFLMMDADLYINSRSFSGFIERCADGISTIGYTEAKTENCVYMKISEGKVVSFSRDIKSKFEWCNIAFLNGVKINPNGHFIYEGLQNNLPLRSQMLDVYEIDTQQDYQVLLNNNELYTK